jgi:hypothetical protein
MAKTSPFNKRQVSIIYGKRRARVNWFGSDANFIGIRFFLPRNLNALLAAYRTAKAIPIARLVSIALYHELQKPDPFQFDMTPKTEFEANKYTNQGAIIYKFLSDNKGGMAKDLLLMSGSLIGIPDMDGMLHGIRELVEIGLLEEVVSIGGSIIPWVQIKQFIKPDDVYQVRRYFKG